MNIKEVLDTLPDTDKKVIVTHSGGMDSSTAVILACEKYGPDNVVSLGFNYGQKQQKELIRASLLCFQLGVKRDILDLSILGDITRLVSTNIAGSHIEMPTIKDILGNPQPPTYVPFRNMIMFSLAAAVAETNQASHIICGLQVHDSYSYWDTTPEFVDAINNVWAINRKNPIQLISPFAMLSKKQELELLKEIGKLDLMELTLTCYNPNEVGQSCGTCPSCAERIYAFMQIGEVDPIEYSIDIPWRK